MKVLAALGFMLLVSCTTGQTGKVGHAADTPHPTSQPLRIAVLSGMYGTTSTVTIADLAGQVVARATFASMPRPLITNAGDILPAAVRLAAGAAYYAEPAGRIHRLDPAGADAVVATFPLTNAQQELSFAVSRDGRQLIAIVLTAPPVHEPPPKDISQPFFQPGTRWSEELESASAGGSTRSLATTDLGPAEHPIGPPVTIAGWDDQGPVALLNTSLAAQSPPASRKLPGSALVHLKLDGTLGNQIGGSDCHPLDELRDGTTLCYTGVWPSAYEVRSAAGQLIWRQDLAGGFYYDPMLSPDGRRIAVDNALFTQGVGPVSVARQVNPRLPVQAVGWVTASSLAIAAGGGTVQIADVTDLAHPRDTGLAGMYIGTL